MVSRYLGVTYLRGDKGIEPHILHWRKRYAEARSSHVERNLARIEREIASDLANDGHCCAAFREMARRDHHVRD